MKRAYIYVIMLLGLLVAGCQEPEDTKPVEVAGPKLVSSVPADGAEGLEGNELTVKLTYDQNIKCPSDRKALITIEGGAVIDDVKAYMADLTIKVSGLENGGQYTLTVPEGAVQGYRTNQAGSQELVLNEVCRTICPFCPGPVQGSCESECDQGGEECICIPS